MKGERHESAMNIAIRGNDPRGSPMQVMLQHFATESPALIVLTESCIPFMTMPMTLS